MLPLIVEFLTFDFDDAMLTEANIINIKDKMNQDTSIHEYLKQYTEMLGTPELKNLFVKKIATLLVNDERFHMAVRELPADAPDWAKKAQQEQLLYAFVPTPALNDILTHMVHYLSTADHDSKKAATNDAKIFAQREIQGFPKAESLDLLDKKAKEYFARGAKKETRDVAGMEHVMDVDGGFAWYKLVEPSAYQREGKTLQNCIGRNYTAESCRRDHTVIFVLRDANNNSVVATRIREESKGNWVVQEMKGKQNKPPVGKYMPPVIELFAKKKLALSDGANYDLTAAGYYYHEGKLYTKSQAIKTLVPFDVIEKIGYGLTLGKIATSDLVQRLYHDIVGYNRVPLYESRDSNGNPVVTVYVNDEKVVSNIWFHPTEHVVVENKISLASLAGESKESLLIRETIAALFKHDIVTGFSAAVNKEFFWNRKETFDPETKTFTPIVADVEHEFSKDESAWKEYTSKQVIQSVLDTLSKYSYGSETQFALPHTKDIKSVIMTTDATEVDGDTRIKPHRILFRDKNNKVYPAIVGTNHYGGMYSPERFAMAPGAPEHLSHDDIADEHTALTKSLASLANKEGLELSPSAMFASGVFKNKAGKYEKLTINQEPVGTKGAAKVDFSKLPTKNRNEAIFYVLKHPELSHRDGERKKRSFEIDVVDIKEIEPTHIIRVPVQYGSKTAPEKHTITLLMKDNDVMMIDVPTRGHKWRRWDDYQTVMTQLNAFIEENKLTVNDRATKDKEGRGIYRNRGQIVSTKGKFDLRSNIEQRRIERNVQRGKYGAEGADEVPFVGGQKIVRAEPQEQATFMRTVIGASKRGEMWKVLDDAGTPRAVFFVQGKKIVASYYDSSSDQGVGQGELNARINNPGFGRYLRLVKGAADKFGWTFKPFNAMAITRGSDWYSHLSSLEHHGAAGKRVKATPDLRALADAGLITITAEDTRHRATITRAGEEVVRGVRNQDPTKYMTSLIQGAPVTDDFKIEKKERPAAAPAGAAAPAADAREGTKADMAVQRFRQMMAANNNVPPSRQEFMRVMQQAPFNMGAAGAQTYYYTTKKRVAQVVGEHTELGRLLLLDDPDGPFALFNEFLANSAS